MRDDLIARIERGRSGFSKGQNRIADYILTNSDKAAYMTAHRLGETAGVSESTVVRFATELGYIGYPHMQRVLRDMVHTRLTSLQRLELTWERMEGRSVRSGVMDNDILKIRASLDMVDEQSFERAVEMILNAKRIYIMGIRTSHFLAGFLGFYFKLLFPDVVIIGGTAGDGDIFESLLRVGKGDVVIAISFPRYSRRTLKGMRFARDRGAGIVSITDSAASPIAAACDCALFAPTEMASFVDSLVAPLSLINALIVAVGQRKKAEIMQSFETLESIWDEYEAYHPDKDD